MLHSIVVPIFNEASGIDLLHARLAAVIDRHEDDFEVILVDDGSRDGSGEALERVHRRDPRFKVLRFSRNFGHQAAITAGIEWARGETVTVIDADLQDPPETIPRLIAKWREGFEVVHAVRDRREGETRFKLWTAAVFYRLLRAGSRVDLPVDSGDFRLMDRRAAAAFLRLKERNRYVRGMVSWIGFRQAQVRYVRERRQFGETHFPVSRMMRFAWDGLLSFSDLPARAILWLGAVGVSLSALGLLAALVMRPSRALEPALLLALLFAVNLVLLSCGILGQYLARIHDEVRGRPLYVIDRAEGFESRPRARSAHEIPEAV